VGDAPRRAEFTADENVHANVYFFDMNNTSDARHKKRATGTFPPRTHRFSASIKVSSNAELIVLTLDGR
jgi:hypothetical protein